MELVGALQEYLAHKKQPPPRTLGRVRRRVGHSAAKREGINLKGFKDFYLHTKDMIWPWLAYLFQVGSREGPCLPPWSNPAALGPYGKAKNAHSPQESRPPHRFPAKREKLKRFIDFYASGGALLLRGQGAGPDRS